MRPLVPSLRRTTLLLVAFLAATAPARAEESPRDGERLTIDDAVRTALANHPTLVAARAQIDAGHARAHQAMAPLFPALTASLSYLPQTANPSLSPSVQRALVTSSSVSIGVTCLPTDPACTNPAPCVLTATAAMAGTCRSTSTTSSSPSTSSTMYGYFSSSLGIAWTLFDFGRTWYGWKASQENEAALRESFAAAENQVRLDARTAFYAALAADALVEVSQESVETQKRHLQQMQGFVDVGTRTPVDLAQTRGDLANAQLTLARAKGTRAQAMAQLQANLGMDRWNDLVLQPTGAPSSEVPIGDDGVDQAVASRPETRQVAAQERAAERTEKAARGAYFPSLSLAMGPTFNGGSLDNLATNFQVSLSLSYGNFNPLLSWGQQKEAEANRAVTRAQARSSKNAIRLETAQALATLRAAVEAVTATQTLIEAAAERRKLANGRFEAGLGTVLELSDAELSYVNARQQFVQSQFDLGTARARLDKSMGR